jgi:hypothetical protein
MLRADSVFIIDGHDCEHFDMYRSGAYEAKMEAERQVAYERIMQLLPKKNGVCSQDCMQDYTAINHLRFDLFSQENILATLNILQLDSVIVLQQVTSLGN